MFNNHFFNENESYLKFLKTSKKMFVIIDPPYGGIIKLIANTIESIKKSILYLGFHNFYLNIKNVYFF